MSQTFNKPSVLIPILCVAVMIACPKPSRDEIDTYLNTLPAGQAPEQRKVETLSSTVTQLSDQTGPKACAIEKKRITETFEDVALLAAANGNILPGLAIQAKTVFDGTLQGLPLARGPMTYVIDLPIANPQFDVKQVTIGSAQEALSTLQLRAADIDAPTRLSYNAEVVSSFEHTANSLGVAAQFASPLVRAGFSASFGESRSLTQRTIVAKLIQPMYTLTVADDKVAQAADFFAEDVTIDQIKALEAQGLIGPANLPTFIKAVTYGRVLYYSITTEDAASNEELSVAVNASYLGFGSDLNAKNTYQRIMSRATVQVLALGGAQDDALAAIRSGDFTLFIKPVKVTQAIPIAYKLNYMHRDRSVVAIRSALDYTLRDCTACSLTKVMENRAIFTKHYDEVGGLFGRTFDDLFGGTCSSGWTRSEVTRPAFNGGGTCDPHWASNEPTNCTVLVHFGIPVFQGLTCDVWAWETREVPGQPPLCPSP
jgi:Thiol-activated cytolysin